MKKSNLGITVNLLSAILYFLIATGNIFLIVITSAYILFFEETIQLKKTAIKVLILGIFFAILTLSISELLSLISYIITTLHSLDIIVSDRLNFTFILLNVVQSISGSLNTFIRIILILISIKLGFQAYNEKDIKIKWIDILIDKNI